MTRTAAAAMRAASIATILRAAVALALLTESPAASAAAASAPAFERARAQACAGKNAGLMARACASAARDARSPQAAFDLATALAVAGRAERARELADELAARPDLGPWGTARLELLRGVILEAAAGRHDAGDHYARALAELRARPGAPATLMADVLMARGSWITTMRKSDAAQADALYDEAEAVLVAAGMTISMPMADLLNYRTMLANARDDWDGVVRFAERERDLVHRLEGPDSPEQLDALVTLANVASTQRRYADALVHLNEGHRIGRLWPHARPSAYLGVLNALAAVLPELGRPLQALEAADEALRFAAATWGERSPHLPALLDRRAYAEESLGRFAAARATLERLLDMLRTEGQNVTLERRMRLMDHAAAFFLRMNDLDTAQRLLDEFDALLPADGSMKYWRGRALQRAGLMAGAENRWADADALFGQAVPLLAVRVGASNPYVVMSSAMRCTAQVRSGVDAVACREVLDRLPTLSGTGAGEGLWIRRALVEHALDHAVHALATAAPDQSLGRRWSALDTAAASLHAAGRHDLAVLLGKAAVEQIEEARNDLASIRDLETSYLRDKHAVYRRLADWLAEAGRVDEALAVLRLLKAREVVDFVRGRSSDGAPGARERMPWTDAERRWRDASPLGVPMPAAPLGPAVVQQSDALGHDRVQAWRRALAVAPASASAPASGADEANLRTTTPPPVQARHRDELLATVFLGRHHVNVVLESAQGRRLVRTPTDTQALVRDTGRLLAAIERRDDVLPLLRSLHERVARPIDDEARRIGATRLLLRVDGELRYLPFAALHDGRTHLVERVAVMQLAPGIERDGVRATPAAPWVQAFGSTRAASGLPALAGVAAELCSIVDGRVVADARGADACATGRTRKPGTVRGQGWLDAAFTAPRLRAAAESGAPDRYDLLHIGSHFVLRPGEIGASWFQLGDGTKLALHDILRWRFDSQDVVTLAACQTGAGGGAEVDGLAWLLLGRGAGSVVASLWQVGDAGTSRLVADAYRHMRNSRDPAAALRDAQLKALADRARAHPYHWAAFTVTSAGR